ncbi:MAG: DNA cytosine methyltransferase [Fulvimarina manganoxydans]|uniref:DNA cytosine methyltransferase n=1 Tax=Fulvimarina manganoxydans TaxID=937218 RepID=UPI0023555C3A|nr:DNA cytosine methyltransferase [Fulvimarina manganoxydans]MCK5932924.1 DNA cytosine methyltransferase [Fulvimarina manganoxydans]
MLLSLFCGAGGLDLGFEDVGFEIGLAFDKKLDSVKSYNHNRHSETAHCRDVRELNLGELDKLWGSEFRPEGVIGGPPCQSFSQANRSVTEKDPRHTLPLVYADLLTSLNARSPLKFFVLENVPGLESSRHIHRLLELEERLGQAGFVVYRKILNAFTFSTPQLRERLFLVGLNKQLVDHKSWDWPSPCSNDKAPKTVRDAIGMLPAPTYFDQALTAEKIAYHRNHWCMRPKSVKFRTEGALVPGNANHRSFKTLSWDKPSITVAYGNREVHIHPSCHRRLSVFEGMLLQGFPRNYELVGSLSSQIAQVSEAVPPPLAKAVAGALVKLQPVSMQLEQQRLELASKLPSLAAAHAAQAKPSIPSNRNWRRIEEIQSR